MLFLAAVFTAAESPSPSVGVDPTLVTPGPIGFTVFALLLLAVAALVWDLLRRVRRARYRQEIAEKLDAEEAAAQQDGGRPEPPR